MGRVATTAPAITIPKFAPNCPTRTERARGIVLILLVCIMTRGHTKLFHCCRNVNIASVASTGFIRGSITFRYIMNSLHPSILAASIRSSGML